MSATLQNIVQTHMGKLGPMSFQQRKALLNISTCGTPEQGEVVMRCNHCDTTQRHWASCGNRHCNRCGHHHNAQWLENQLDNLLPVPHFMVTITIPEHLRVIFRYNQKICYDLLFRCGVDSVHAGMRDKQSWGDHIKIGSAAFLHTWTQDLNYHPHLHMVIPAGGYDPDDQEWHPIDGKFLGTYQIISTLFKGKLCASLTQSFKKGTLKLPPDRDDFTSADEFKRWLQGKRDIHWRIHVSSPHGGSCGAMDYMARYVNRTAIGNNRILLANDEEVIIQTRDREKQIDRQVRLEPLTFLRRFLAHVLPKGFTRVRWFGWMSCAKRKQSIASIRDILCDASPPVSMKTLTRVICDMNQRLALSRCPVCEQGTMVFSSLLRPRSSIRTAQHQNLPTPIHLSPH